MVSDEEVLRLEAQLDELEQRIPMAAASDADEHDDMEDERAELIARIEAAATISNKRMAELEDALAKVRRYALAGEGPTFDLILAVSDAALNTRETDRGE